MTEWRQKCQNLHALNSSLAVTRNNLLAKLSEQKDEISRLKGIILEGKYEWKGKFKLFKYIFKLFLL